MRLNILFIATTSILALSMHLQAQVNPSAFVNYEIPPVHALQMSPNGQYLAAVNTPDMRIEIYSLSQGIPTHEGSVSVGLEPTSVRFRSNNELWVVNNLSDSVSIIDVAQRRVTATLRTLDDPHDVVFAGSPQRAFISCGLPRSLQVFNPANLTSAPIVVPLQGNNPRALAISPDGSKVHVAFFHSGNRTTILSGGTSAPSSSIANFPPDMVTNSAGPHGGVNPPPNAGGQFTPVRNTAAGTPPKVSLIVRQDAQGKWRDDTGADWTQWVSGANASMSGRYPGWTLLDRDLAVVDANTLSVGYVSDLMNLCMALDVNPASGSVTVVGTEAHNEIRFEPNIQAQFIDVVAASANPVSLLATGRSDLNSALVSQFTGAQLSPALRATAIGDPRSIKWKSDGSVAYVAGMGSNNIVPINSSGQRVGPVIAVREGPVGLAIDEARNQLYVQNRFHGSISVIDLDNGSESFLVSYFDPTPTVIRTGRKHLYDTHHTSAIGQISCGSCHIDGRMDRLSWDLGNPAGNNIALSSRDLNRSSNSVLPIVGVLGTGSLTNFHPMKGPMLTQTLQDIIGHEPLHWRGDRFGIEEFNDAFHDLQGRATLLTTAEMAEFKAFLSTIHFPPNPFRNIDNTLPTNLNLSGHFATGRFTLAAGNPLPNGNAVAGLTQYRDKSLGIGALDRGAFACVSCHTLPTGGSTDRRWQSGNWVPIARGTHDENHLMVMGASDVASFTTPIQNTMKVPHLRNIHERVGFNVRPGTQSLHGFGHMHDGNIPAIAEFISNPAFIFTSDQQIANVVALMLSWSGSDFRETNGSLIVNNGNVSLEPPGVFSKDSHSGVGQQETISIPSQSLTRLNQLVVADSSARVELIAKTYGPAGNRGYLLTGSNFLADYPGEQKTQAQLVAATGNGNVVTFTLVPAGTGQRLGRDRDLDGYLDYEEIVNCTDPNDPNSFGSGQCAEVVASYAYHSGWTGSANPQWDALDTGKVLASPGASPAALGLNNLINTIHGINGLVFDIVGLDSPEDAQWQFTWSPQEAFDANANPIANWQPAPAPSITMHTAQGTSGSDRFLLQWPNQQIVNRWLCVKITIGTATKTYVLGHLTGECTGPSGNAFTVMVDDILAVRAQLATSASASSIVDVDKSGLVLVSDILATRSNLTKQLTQITLPAAP
jgi:YVTN family beta-propeller protein